jgi:hypothetical protein
MSISFVIWASVWSRLHIHNRMRSTSVNVISSLSDRRVWLFAETHARPFVGHDTKVSELFGSREPNLDNFRR